MEDIGRVFIWDRTHPHAGESGFLTGKIISLFGELMAEVSLENCKHGTDGCFVRKGQIAKDWRGTKRGSKPVARRAGKKKSTSRSTPTRRAETA